MQGYFNISKADHEFIAFGNGRLENLDQTKSTKDIWRS